MKTTTVHILLFQALFVHGKDSGLPVSNPTISYWQTPPHPNVADHRSSQLPDIVDVVIIGSGMTGTSIAHHILTNGSQTQPLRIAMLEARQACSGATGRNGGHIRPSSYAEYDEQKEVVGQAEAVKITKLRAAHVDALISAANELGEAGREASEARSVDSIDAFFDNASYTKAVEQLAILRKEVPEIGAEWTSWDQEAARDISLLPQTTGILTGSPKIAGAIWPYRFVTHILDALLQNYSSFSLDTNTPATGIRSVENSSASNAVLEVTTPRGVIRTRHVVHAANSWIPHLVPGLEDKIVGMRLHMSAQLGGARLPKAGQWPPYTGNGSLPTGRAWTLFRNGLDYAVQMPRDGEFMFGGGDGIETAELTMDDSLPPSHTVASYLNGALPNYFGYANWGNERTDFPQPNDAAVFPGRTKRVWTGIEGAASDGRPFVGMIPESATRRSRRNGTVGAEWISAAYNGEGMCYAWLSGQALASMLLGSEGPGGNHTLPDWFPTSFELTEDRLKNKTVRRSTERMGRMGRVFRDQN